MLDGIQEQRWRPHRGQERRLCHDCPPGTGRGRCPEGVPRVRALGPRSFHLTVLKTAHFGELVVSRTGYTGAGGVEIFLDPGAAPALWRAFLDLGAVPCGLGARDTLRLEMGYPLHGNDITDETTPLEAGLSFAVDFDKPDFIGRDALLDQKGRGVTGDLWVSSFLSAASRANTAAASKTGDRSARSPRGASRP